MIDKNAVTEKFKGISPLYDERLQQNGTEHNRKIVSGGFQCSTVVATIYVRM